MERQGYKYVYAPDIAPDSVAPERESFEQVLLAGRLERAVCRINPAIPDLEALVGSENRINTIAKDIITHFEQRQVVFEGSNKKN